MAVLLAAAGRAFAGDAGTQAAVWREQAVDFVFFGRTARYSCDGLRDKVRALLVELGARRDLRIAAAGCEDAGRLLLRGVRSPSLRIVFSAPMLPEAGAKPLHPGDPSPVDARFEDFTIASDVFRNMGLGDCELVEDFVRQVLPKLVTRNVQTNISCIPNQLSGSRYRVRGQILKPATRSAQGERPESGH